MLASIAHTYDILFLKPKINIITSSNHRVGQCAVIVDKCVPALSRFASAPWRFPADGTCDYYLASGGKFLLQDTQEEEGRAAKTALASDHSGGGVWAQPTLLGWLNIDSGRYFR